MVNGPTHINDADLYLRPGTDHNHGLGWYGAGGGAKPFGSQNPDGPVLYGWAGGILGTMSGGANWSLKWDASGNITARGTISPSSDRNIKTNFTAIDPSDVLNKVSAMPISSWSYKEDANTRHIGPMAQDFSAAFAVGADDKHIATVDADGVALAAIQGLHALVREKDAELGALREKLAALEKGALAQAVENSRLEDRLNQLTESLQTLQTRGDSQKTKTLSLAQEP